jgi:transposase
MDHLAIDLGGRESQICVRGSDGRILEERRWPTRRLGAYLAGRPTSRVIVETCAEAFGVAEAAVAAGHEVRIVPARLVRTLGVGARRLKTDRRDAQVLSEVSCRIDLPSVHLPSPRARQHKTLCGMRDALVRARTQLINTVRGWLRGEGRRLRSGAVESFPARVQALAAESPLPAAVTRQIEAIAQLTAQIAAADRELAQAARTDPVTRRLMTVPGVGPTTAVRFVAAVDDVTRFASAHALESYLGLTPGEDSSSDRHRRTGITKAGASALRWCLVQAAWAAQRTRRRTPLQAWAETIAQRRGARIATVALARKLAGILYALWRDDTTYVPWRAAS